MDLEDIITEHVEKQCKINLKYEKERIKIIKFLKKNFKLNIVKTTEEINKIGWHHQKEQIFGSFEICEKYSFFIDYRINTGYKDWNIFYIKPLHISKKNGFSNLKDLKKWMMENNEFKDHLIAQKEKRKLEKSVKMDLDQPKKKANKI